MRNLSLPESEATAVQSKGGPGRPSEASREAAALDGNRRREAMPFRWCLIPRVLSLASVCRRP